MEIMLYLLGILIVVLGIALSIGLHEVGHLVPAKLFKVKVSQFMIGFGRTIWSKQKGETEYGVKMLPLGGYVAMSGMYPPARPGSKPRPSTTGFFQSMVDEARSAAAQTIDEGEEHRTFYRLPAWQKIIIMLGGPVVNLVLAFVFFAVLLSGIGISTPTTTIGGVTECLVPAGSNITDCGEADPQAPARAAGLKPGDTVVAVAGTAVTDWETFRSTVAENPGTPLTVVVAVSYTHLTLPTNREV